MMGTRGTTGAGERERCFGQRRLKSREEEARDEGGTEGERRVREVVPRGPLIFEELPGSA